MSWIMGLIGLIVLSCFVLLLIMLGKQNEPARREGFKKEFQNKYHETLILSQTNIVNEEFIHRLNNALKADFMETVNTEFRLQFPRYSQNQVNELWRELKRYFLMAAVFKKIEMFNVKVDELWHIMLKFEKEYNEFCEMFIGRRIHHIPHGQPMFKPAERTFFDFCYVQLFSVDSVSLKIWGRFFKHGKGKELLQEFENGKMTKLKDKYMHDSPSSLGEKVFESFVSRFKEYKLDKSPIWQHSYKDSSDASYAYFAYVSTNDKDDSFGDLFGHDSSDSHGSHDGGHGGSDSSSCSSCSSCSSS